MMPSRQCWKPYKEWLDSIKAALQSKRGRASDLARTIGTCRQNVSKWFVIQNREVPGWVVIGTLDWYSSLVARSGDKPTIQL